MVQTLLGKVNSIKVKKVETTIHYRKQPQLSVRVSMTESLNEEMEIKQSSLSVLLQLIPDLVCFCSILLFFCATFILITALLGLELARKAYKSLYLYT
jgi:hypothetical protein